MKLNVIKKCLAVGAVVGVMTVGFTACSSSDTSESSTSVTKAEDAATDAEAETSEEPAASEEAEEKGTPIAIGDVITTDSAEITIKNIEFSYDVLPDDTSSYYTHYAAESGKVYVHVDTDIKNIQKQNLSVDDIANVTVDYDDGYEYNAYATPEDSSLGFTYANITSIKPLDSLGVRYLANCPEEVATSGKPVKVYFDINGDTYVYNLVQ